MAQTDSPLKDLVESSILDFAAWLFNTEVVSAQALNVEFTGQDARVDRLFEVLLSDGRTATLHIEFQGRSTHEPVRFRMLDYMTRIVRDERDLNLHSVVFYVGDGVGALDTGDHQIIGLDGQPALHWRYQVVHLWKIKAETLVALNRPGLSALVGLTQIDDPATVIPQVVEQIEAVENEEVRRHLLAALIALISDQEIVQMIRKMVKEEGLLMNTPFLREVRAEERNTTHRNTLLHSIAWRYDPPLSVYQKIEQAISTIEDENAFMALHKAIIQTENFQEFYQIFNDVIAQQPKVNVSA